MHTNPETLALLALGEQVGTADERSHVAGCAACSAEVADLAHLVGVGRATTSADTLSAPSPEVWERIQAELGFTSDPSARHNGQTATGAVADERSDVIDLASRPRRASAGRRLLSLAVAAALALIAGVGIGVGWNRLSDREETVATAELKPLPRWAGTVGEVALQVDGDGRRWLVVSVTNPPRVAAAPQVWVRSVTVPDEMINLGPFVGNGQRIRIDNAVDLRRFPLVDISDEPDAIPTHSGDTIVWGLLNL